jgi:alpha-beta hydrolase superfamily lysophospholipase
MGTYAEGSPTFLMGHSFGGLVSTHSVMAARRHWRGLLLSSAYFGLGMDVPWIKVAVGKVASRVVPRLAMPTGLNGAMCTRHEGRAREYEEDPLGFKTATTRWFTEAQRAQEQALAQASQIELPVLAFFGTEDRIAKAEAAKAVFDGFRCADKTWKTYEGMRHETWNEIGWEQVAADVSSWVKAHSDG